MNNMDWTSLCARFVVALAGMLAVAFVSAQSTSFPSKPVHLIIGFPPGGGSDVVARQLTARMSDALGQPVVVENRAGAGGSIAAAAVANAPPDGHTIYLATASNAINSAGARLGTIKTEVDVQRDFLPIVLLVRNQNVLVAHPAVPVANMGALIALARERPGKLNFGVMTPASQLAGELLRQMANIAITDIPYKGAAPVVADLLGGQVELAIIDVVAVLSHLKSGKLRAIAVTSPRRFAGLPDVPTIAESGVPGYEAAGWLGLMAPMRTPPEAIERLRSAAARAVDAPELQDKLASLGVTPTTGTSEAFGTFVADEIAKWSRVMRAGNITLGN